jgi:hypothetical protein
MTELPFEEALRLCADEQTLDEYDALFKDGITGRSYYLVDGTQLLYRTNDEIRRGGFEKWLRAHQIRLRLVEDVRARVASGKWHYRGRRHIAARREAIPPETARVLIPYERVDSGWTARVEFQIMYWSLTVVAQPSTQHEVDAWMDNWVNMHPGKKQSEAVQQCMKRTGATRVEALAAHRKLPETKRNSRGRPKKNPGM